MAIHQQAIPPYRTECDRCGQVWHAQPARGKSHPTASSLDREAMEHWQQCQPKSAVRT